MDDNKKPLRTDLGKPFAQMTPGEKTRFILKLVVCILTFGMAFPNVMSE
jgi:hypothetical protein